MLHVLGINPFEMKFFENIYFLTKVYNFENELTVSFSYYQLFQIPIICTSTGAFQFFIKRFTFSLALEFLHFRHTLFST